MVFIIALIKIIILDLVLSGDNAVVIALATRLLEPSQAKKALAWGTAGAVGLRIVFTCCAVLLLYIPYLQAVGSVVLLWIAIKLLKGEDGDGEVKAGSTLTRAIGTIIAADFIMSLDNILAVAGSSEGNIILIIIGLIISIPMIMLGSQLIAAMMKKFPIIIWIGGGLLGWTAGDMFMNDGHTGTWFLNSVIDNHYLIPACTTILALGIGYYLNSRDGHIE